LLVIGLLLWLALLSPVLTHWVVPTIGVSLVLTVSTESVAVLSAALAAAQSTRWLLLAALAPFVPGLVFYAFVIARFDFRQVGVGHCDHWITGGALAISTLAAARITLAGRSLHALVGIGGVLKLVTVLLWGLSILWLPLLLFAEVVRPRLGHDVRRWSTVFPVGMYAACTFLAGSAAHVSAITDFAKVWVWVGVAVWLVVFAAMLARGLDLARAGR
jgi:voltage-gated anion channel